MPRRRVAGPFWAQAVNQNHIFFKNPNTHRIARNYVAWLFAVIGGSVAIKPRKSFQGPRWTGGNLPRHHFSCAYLARILRQSLFRLDQVFSETVLYNAVYSGVIAEDLFPKGINDTCK